MCYDISFTVNIRAITDFFPETVFDPQLNLEFGMADHIQGVSVFGEHPILYMNRETMQINCRPMQWSCIEFFRKEMPDMKRRNGMLNIRAERVLNDPASYWYKIRNRRCLVPVTSIFEHRAIPGWKKKVPYAVRPRDQSVFFLAGLYSVAELPDKTTGELVKTWTFGLITRSANSLMQQIHNDGENKHRMPLFLPLEMSKEFISDTLSPERYAAILNYEMPSADLAYHTVYTIRSPKGRPDEKGKHEAWEWESLPELES